MKLANAFVLNYNHDIEHKCREQRAPLLPGEFGKVTGACTFSNIKGCFYVYWLIAF